MKLGRGIGLRIYRQYTDNDAAYFRGDLLVEDFQAYSDVGIDIKVIKKKTAGEIVTNDQIRMPYASIDLAKMDSLFGGGKLLLHPGFSVSTEHFLGASARNHPTASRPHRGIFCQV